MDSFQGATNKEIDFTKSTVASFTLLYDQHYLTLIILFNYATMLEMKHSCINTKENKTYRKNIIKNCWKMKAMDNDGPNMVQADGH